MLLWLSTEIIAVVERIIFRQVGPGLGQFLDGCHQRVIFGRESKSFNLHIRAFGQLRPWLKDDRAVDDFSGDTHG